MSKALTQIETKKRGRPASVSNRAKEVIGDCILEALEKADLHVVSGNILRELALIVGKPTPEPKANDETEP